MQIKTLPENAHIVEAIAPAANGSALNGDFIDMSQASEVAVVVQATQGNATVVSLTLEQATDNAASDVKAITNNVRVFSNLDCAAGDSFTERDEAKGYDTDAGLKHKIIIFQVDANALDINNGFTHLRVKAAASNAANIISAIYVATGQRYEGASMIG